MAEGIKKAHLDLKKWSLNQEPHSRKELEAWGGDLANQGKCHCSQGLLQSQHRRKQCSCCERSANPCHGSWWHSPLISTLLQLWIPPRPHPGRYPRVWWAVTALHAPKLLLQWSCKCSKPEAVPGHLPLLQAPLGSTRVPNTSRCLCSCSNWKTGLDCSDTATEEAEELNDEGHYIWGTFNPGMLTPDSQDFPDPHSMKFMTAGLLLNILEDTETTNPVTVE